MELIEIDPTELVQYAGNVRENPGDLAGMVATMREVGVVQPIMVRQNGDGHYEVLAGKRRTAAALQAGLKLIPALVVTGDEGPDRLRSLIENVQRKDLTPTEEAEGWRQLQIAGMDENAIAKVMGVAADRIQKGLAVGASSVATAVTRKYDLTLEQGAVLAEFEDDKESVKRLTEAAVKRPADFAHLASRLRQDRAAKVAREAAIAKLAKGKIEVYEGPIASYGVAGPKMIDDLVDAKGKKLGAAAHKKCPGNVARVHTNWDGKVSVEYVCLDPAANGHKSRYGTSGDGRPAAGTEEAESARAARAATIAGNKEWRAAEPVRREFVRDLLGKRKPTAALQGAVLAFVADEVLGCPDDLATTNRTKADEMLTDLTGVKPGKASYIYSRHVGLAIASKATTATLPLAMLAQVAAVRELTMDTTAWRNPSSGHARWLRFLEKQGYTLSAIEQKLVKAAPR